MDIEHHTITRNGFRWHAACSGPRDAPPVLLLHCWTGNWTMWQATMERLSHGYRCIAPDQLGCGQSDKPEGDHYQIDQQAERARFILDEFGIERAHVVGHSMGGQIALTLAALHPETVTSLVVVDPPVTGRLHPLGRMLMFYPVLARYGFEFHYTWTMNLMDRFPGVGVQLMHFLFPHPGRQREAALYWAKQLGADGQLQASGWSAKSILEWDVTPLLKQISAPTLAIWGMKDWFIPAGECAVLERQLADCRAVRIPGVGHFPMIEAFDAYVRAIEQFLASARSQQRLD